MGRKKAHGVADWMAGSAAQPVTSRGKAQLPRSPNEILEPVRPAPPARSGRGKVRPPKGPRRGRATVGFLNASLTILLVLMVLGGGSAYALKYAFEQPGPLDHSTIVVIPQGEGLTGIASRLQREGVVTDSRVLLAGYYWSRTKTYFTGGRAPALKAGEYEIRKGASMRQVIDTLVEGKAILMKVTVPEGLTSYQIVQILKAQHDLTGDVTEIPAEGSLLPDTYKFSRGTDRKEIIVRMQADAKKFVAKQWETRASRVPFKTPDEAIIMASLVEKETGKADERDRVAGVFFNRLAKKMRLQSDPTIIYVVTGGKGNLGRGITRSEIDAKNEYNTYQIEGMPPTPICNPGRASIEAVLNPATTEDLYFVADGSGGHAFAASIRDHQNNVKRWRQLERDTKAKAAASAAEQNAAQDQTAGPGVALDIPGVTVEGAAAKPAAAASSDPNADATTAEDTIPPEPAPEDTASQAPAPTNVATKAAGAKPAATAKAAKKAKAPKTP